MAGQDYPKLLARIKATVADMIILLILMTTVTQVFAGFENVPDSARMIAFVFVFGLYDPLLPAFLEVH